MRISFQMIQHFRTNGLLFNFNFRKSFLLLSILIFTIYLPVYANSTKADSLINSIKPSTHDTIKIIAYLDAGYLYESYNLDKALQFYNMSLDLSVKHLSAFSSNAGKSINASAAIKKNKENKSYLIFLEKSYRYRGIVQFLKGNLPDALDDYQQSLKISEQLNDKSEVSKCLSNIGMVLREQGNYSQALDYFQRGLHLNKEIEDLQGILSCLNSIGGIFLIQNDYFMALKYFQESLNLNKSLNNKEEISACLSNIGVVYRKLKDYSKAIRYYSEALKIDEELNDQRSVAIVLNNIGIIYSLINNQGKAIEYSLKSLEIAKKIGLKETMRYSYGSLAESYAKTNDFAKAYKYFTMYSAIKDTIYNEQSNRLLSEMEAKYQTEKKQKEIEILNKDKALQRTEIARQEAEVKQQTTQKYAFISGFIFMLAMALIVYKGYRQKKKANQLLALQNEEIKQQKEEIETQRDEIETQKEILENKNSEITDSINYAKRIQQAVLPDLAAILSPKHQVPSSKTQGGLEFGTWNLKFESFVLFKPKDIVSGDFYWANLINEWLIITVADCTGHGVPGAFMSMLGVSFLNEIIRKKEITKACEVLDHLRESVIEALQQKGVSTNPATYLSDIKDGMDIAFCAINTNTMEMQFAGANNPCYVIVNTQPVIAMAQPEAISTAQSDCFVPYNDKYNFVDPIIELSDSEPVELIEIKGDKMPIGIHSNMQPFKNQIYQLQKGDIIYLMSDGYEDQFGGPNRKKFLAKNLKTLLTANSQLPMVNQQEILNNTFENWKGEFEQIDDVTIIGIKI